MNDYDFDCMKRQALHIHDSAADTNAHVRGNYYHAACISRQGRDLSAVTFVEALLYWVRK